ncbi:hypothetical protein KI387_001598, partial [Taxus chinensis]
YDRNTEILQHASEEEEENSKIYDALESIQVREDKKKRKNKEMDGKKENVKDMVSNMVHNQVWEDENYEFLHACVSELFDM